MGTSTFVPLLSISVEDHPHACGDKTIKKEVSSDEPGSSPRVWGQVQHCTGQLMRAGIIPTRVGTRQSADGRKSFSRDHPHACGDKNIFRFRQARRRGSSPRVWGQAFSFHGGDCNTGIIPTRVGTRSIFLPLSALHEDHPHACGDKSYNYAPYPHIQGSSPRVWGQDRRRRLRLHRCGIIPTRVGTRGKLNFFNVDDEDHPHACGDKWLFITCIRA